MTVKKKLFRMPQRPTTGIKRKISKTTGIPLTKSGRKTKMRRMLTPGCAVPLLALLAIVFAGVSSARSMFSASAAETILTGDLNCDGEITISDAVWLYRLIAEDTTLPITPQGIANADFDADGILGMLDVQRTMKCAAEIEATASTAPTSITDTTPSTSSDKPLSTTSTSTTVTETLSPVYAKVGELQIYPYPLVVRRNEDVTLSIIGRANTEYNINVYYSSGISKADGLENKYSDSEGYVSWTWQIGGKTKFGEYRIDLIGGGAKTTLPFSVEE